MTKQTYEKMTEPFRREGRRLSAIENVNKILTAIVYAAYIVLLVVGAVTRYSGFPQIVLVPAISFAAVTVFRKAVNAKRPYEVLDIEPLIKKDTTGKSFPSRHVFSVFVIAVTLCSVWLPGGIILLVVGVLLAFMRVLGGVHFPRDVIAGALIGIGCGLLCFL